MLEELTLPLPRSAAAIAAPVDVSALVPLYAPILFRVANSLLRSPAEAEDIVQDTFLRVLQQQHKLPDVRDIRPWLIRIAWNLALDRRRRVRPDQAGDLFLQSLVAPAIPVDQAFHDAEQAARVLHALDRLPKPERQVVLLAAQDELSTPEIALIMHKSDSAVRALLHRARTRLRERLQQVEKPQPAKQKAGKR